MNHTQLFRSLVVPLAHLVLLKLDMRNIVIINNVTATLYDIKTIVIHVMCPS